MAEKILNTRVILKNDSLAALNSSTFIPKKGEMVLASVDTWKIDNTTQEKVLVPTYLVKVGDGEHKFSQLNWIAAQAADVHDWAKQSQLPVEDNGTGKFVTDVAWDADKKSLVVSRSDVDAVTLPSYDDKAVSLSFVTEVDQTNGEIATSKAALVQGANITLTQNAAGGDITIAGKDWSEEIAAGNTAHTHKNGTGIKINGTENGGIDGEVQLDLNIAMALIDDDIVIYDKDDVNKTAIATLDATSFIKDGMIESVELVQEDASGNKGQFLKITWNIDDANSTDEGTEKDVVYLNVGDLVDVYTGQAGEDITVTVNEQNVISATLNKSFALASDLNGYKTKQDAYSAEGSTAKTVTKVEQNENGEVTITYSDIVFPTPPVVNDGTFTVSGTGALTGSGSMTANQASDTTATLDVKEGGIDTTRLADTAVTTKKIADHAVGAHQTKACADYTGDDAEVWVFDCGSATVNIS